MIHLLHVCVTTNLCIFMNLPSVIFVLDFFTLINDSVPQPPSSQLYLHLLTDVWSPSSLSYSIGQHCMPSTDQSRTSRRGAPSHLAGVMRVEAGPRGRRKARCWVTTVLTCSRSTDDPTCNTQNKQRRGEHTGTNLRYYLCFLGAHVSSIYRWDYQPLYITHLSAILHYPFISHFTLPWYPHSIVI